MEKTNQGVVKEGKETAVFQQRNFIVRSLTVRLISLGLQLLLFSEHNADNPPVDLSVGTSEQASSVMVK